MPQVSVVIPCYNERATIGLLLGALDKQTFARSEMEVIVVDGQSTDGTLDAVAEFRAQHPHLNVRLVANPQRSIPAALNQGIHAAQGTYIVRLDAHSMPEPEYVARCVAALEAGMGANVGGVWQIRPGGDGGVVARAIAAAAAHPLGVGDARYRYTETAAAVDTVPFGAFRRDLVMKIGAFDERLLTNEDYEFNVRVRRSGGTVWLDPAIRSIYFARASFGALARQYWRYGYWKARMLRRYPGTLRWRQALPPLFVLGLLILAVLGTGFPPARGTMLAVLSVYALILMAVGMQVAFKRRDFPLAFGVPIAIATMHLCWGTALLWSTLTAFLRRDR
ncbi:MAG: glycosyltransferase family 2 protein [Chloroflexota bacterium]